MSILLLFRYIFSFWEENLLGSYWRIKWWVHSSAQATITKYHRLGGLNNRYLFSAAFEAESLNQGVGRGWLSSRPFGLQTAVFSCVLLWSFFYVWHPWYLSMCPNILLFFWSHDKACGILAPIQVWNLCLCIGIAVLTTEGSPSKSLYYENTNQIGLETTLNDLIYLNYFFKCPVSKCSQDSSEVLGARTSPCGFLGDSPVIISEDR